MARCKPGQTYYFNANFQLKSALLGVSLPAMIWLNIALLDAGFVVPYFPSVWFSTKIRQALWNKCTMRFLLPAVYVWFIVDINSCVFSNYPFVLQLIPRKLYLANIFHWFPYCRYVQVWIKTKSLKQNPFDFCLESLQQLFGVSSFEYVLNNTLS